MATKNKKKKITKSDIIGEQGIALIHQRVSGMGFLWHATGLEAGIDGFAEIRDDQTGVVTGHFVPIQSKASDGRYTAETESTFQYLCDERDLEYWLNCNAPVVLVVSRPKTGEVYWACIRDRFQDLAARKARRIYFDKKRDCFDQKARDTIAKLAIPKDSGFYLAPPPKEERLYSNLLGVSSFGKHIYVAQTDLRFPGQIWDGLRDSGQSYSGEWVLTDKMLVSFHNLKEEPWCQLCDRGTVEEIDSDAFAFSEDEDAISLFTNLLYVTLKEKLSAEGLRYNRAFDYYYFTATKLGTRTIVYQSLEKTATRVVFRPFYQKLYFPGECICHAARLSSLSAVA